MIEVSYDFWLPAVPGQVFDYLSNPENEAQWESFCRSAELLDRPCGIGGRYRIVFALLGREMRFLGEVTELERPSRCAFRVVEGSFPYTSSYAFEAEGEGTRVHWRFQAEPGGFFGLVPASLLRKVVLSQAAQDTERLRQRWLDSLPA